MIIFSLSGALVKIQPDDFQATNPPRDAQAENQPRTRPIFTAYIHAEHQPRKDKAVDDVHTDLLAHERNNFSNIHVQIDETHLNLIKSDDEIVVASINTIRTFSKITYDRSFKLEIEETIFQDLLVRNASGTL